ncbi:hypothetical protein NQZ79_g3405 [Umbelopsis isabellina]|nr:hypothetical protein NQZ79_g3405 [Umbelopsis isabellina]
MLSQTEGNRSVLRELDRRRYVGGANDSLNNSQNQQINLHSVKRDKFAKPANSQRFSMGGAAMSSGVIRDSVGPQRPVHFKTTTTAQQQHISGSDVVMTEGDTGRPIANGNAGLATPRVARPSIYGGQPTSKPGSIVNSTVGSMPRDPRNVKDRRYQQSSIKLIVEYLSEAGYGQINTKTLMILPSKDFQSIFKFLHSRLDPSYKYDKKKFEEEVPSILKMLKYPMAELFTKSFLSSIAPYSYPTFIALLRWLTEMCQMWDNIQSNDPFENPDEEESDDSIFFSFTISTYNAFLQGSDDFTAMEQELEAIFDERNKRNVEIVRQLSEENAQIEQECESLRQRPSRLIELDDFRKMMERDMQKLYAYEEDMQSKMVKYLDGNKVIQEEIQKKAEELDLKERVRLEWQARVDAQNVSAAEADRLSSEHVQLEKLYEQTRIRLDEIQKIMWEKEVQAEKHQSMLDKAIRSYNSLAYSVGLLPSSAPRAKGHNFELSYNANAETADKMLSVDLRNFVKPALQEIEFEMKEQENALREQNLQIQEKLDAIVEQIMDKNDELKLLQQRFNQRNEEYEHLKEKVRQENIKYNQDAEDSASHLKQIRADAKSALLSWQQKENKLRMEHNQVVRKSNTLKEELSHQISTMLNEFITFKSHIEKQLMDLNQLTKEEYALAMQSSVNWEGVTENNDSMELDL